MASVNKAGDKKVISIWATTSLDRRLKRFAAQTGQQKGALASKILEEYLDKHDTPSNPLLLPQVEQLKQGILEYFRHDLNSSTNLVASLDPNINSYTTSLVERLHKTSPKEKGSFSRSLEHNIEALFLEHSEYHIDLLALQAEALDTYQQEQEQEPQHDDKDTEPTITTNKDTPEDALTLLQSLGPPSSTQPNDTNNDSDFEF